MSLLSHPLTFADLERERETRDERLELIEGDIVVTPSPTPWHQLVSFRLGAMLNQAIVEQGLGLVLAAPLDVVLDDINVVQPDLIVLLHDRHDRFGHKNIAGAPSLAIEILSPSTGARDRGIKRALYARFGVEEYWMVDPDAESVTVCTDLRDGHFRSVMTTQGVATSTVIPAFVADLQALFAPIQGS